MSSDYVDSFAFSKVTLDVIDIVRIKCTFTVCSLLAKWGGVGGTQGYPVNCWGKSKPAKNDENLQSGTQNIKIVQIAKQTK